jgi:hypothetical protein
MLLPGEEEGYRELRDALFAEWAPRGETEALLVHRMAGCAWRLLRCAAIEAELLQTLRDGVASEGGLARAFLDDSSEGGPLLRLARYEAALDRGYQRALRTLWLLQAPRRAGSWRDPEQERATSDRPPRAFWGEEPVPARALSLPWREDGPGDAIWRKVGQILDRRAAVQSGTSPDGEESAPDEPEADGQESEPDDGGPDAREEEEEIGAADATGEETPAEADEWRSGSARRLRGQGAVPGHTRPEADILRNGAGAAPAVSRVFATPSRANDPTGLS